MAARDDGRNDTGVDVPTVSGTGRGTLRTVTRDPAPVLAHGTRLGNFRIEGRLGQGGLGIVYRAYDEKLKRAVAVKVLTEASFAASRLLAEARSAASLTHSAIAAIYEIREYEGLTFIVMELVEGTTLRASIQEGPLGANEALHFARDIAAGLARAHKSGIVHRDLKPENVMVTPDGGAKILDFGLAREVDVVGDVAAGGDAPMSGHTAVAGTPAYMSPEQARGTRVDARSDVFSFGVVLHEMLTGERPKGDAIAPAPASHPVMARVIARCLEQNREARYADAGELVEALRAIPIESLAPRARRGRLGATAWALLTALAAGAAIVVFAALREKPTVTSPAVADVTASPTAPTPSSSLPIKLTDLPAPSSTNAEAVAAYLEGVRSEHDGLNSCYRGFDRAALLDPTMAAASVRLLEIFADAKQYARARVHYRNALAYGDKLSDRDRAICSAFEPGLVWDPVDWAESTNRLRALSKANPNDGYLRYLLAGSLLDNSPSPEGQAEARANLQAATLADPTFGAAWSYLVRLAINEGRSVDARAIGEQCLREAPRATNCLEMMGTLDSLEGNCRGLLSSGRRWISIDPEDRHGHFRVASALAALGEPQDSVEEALSHAVERVAIEDRDARSHHWKSSLAVLLGDFAQADESAKDLARSKATAFDPRDHAIVQRVYLAMERGDDAGAAALAGAYLRRRGAFSPPPLGTDPGPFLLDAQRRGGAISARELRTQLGLWQHEWTTRLAGALPPDAWTVGEARVVETAEEAAHALTTRPPLDKFSAGLDPGAIGKVSLLAGRYDEAEPLLASAARACFVFDAPFDIVRASLHLGLAREGRGDKVGACAAYKAVLARWGSAKPRSITAEKARDRTRALRCTE